MHNAQQVLSVVLVRFYIGSFVPKPRAFERTRLVFGKWDWYLHEEVLDLHCTKGLLYWKRMGFSPLCALLFSKQMNALHAFCCICT